MPTLACRLTFLGAFTLTKLAVVMPPSSSLCPKVPDLKRCVEISVNGNFASLPARASGGERGFGGEGGFKVFNVIMQESV